MSYYYCKHCVKIVKRSGDKRLLYSWCVQTGQRIRLVLIRGTNMKAMTDKEFEEFRSLIWQYTTEPNAEVEAKIRKRLYTGPYSNRPFIAPEEKKRTLTQAIDAWTRYLGY